MVDLTMKRKIITTSKAVDLAIKNYATKDPEGYLSAIAAALCNAGLSHWRTDFLSSAAATR